MRRKGPHIAALSAATARPNDRSSECGCRVRDEWRFPITAEATRIGFKNTGLTGGGPKPSA